ncbi:hypothetical protein J3R30DRAFT_3718159 [Lentinula aciculospora]|uniref:Annexin n=1 Tax=Lentinula aciculospora TaxID=153920 RepID=A0A9W8ZUH1_9AGAR|nr:hypothetical protein J3R30DRAFT_3718159 [Lentinula aciculospora]
MSYNQPPYYQNSQYGAPPNNQGRLSPGGFHMPTSNPPSSLPYSYPASSYQASSPFRDGYAPSYLPPPTSQLYGYSSSDPPPPPSFSTYPGAPPSNQYVPFPQQAVVIHYRNAPVPAPVGYELPPQSDIAPGYDPTMDIDKIRQATKGIGTDEAALSAVLAHLGSLPMASLSAAFKARTGKSLTEVLNNESSAYFGLVLHQAITSSSQKLSLFREILHGLVLGPLWYDVELVQSAIKGAGTDELLMIEIIADLTPSDRQNLSIAYRMRYGRDLQTDIRGDLNAKTERLYTMLLSASLPPDNSPVDFQQVQNDVKALYKAGQGKIGTDEITFCDIIINRSKSHLAALCDAYGRKYKSLTKVIKSEFSAHMRQTLLFIVDGAKSKHAIEFGPGVWRDAKLLEKSMKGFGTKDKQLIRRIVRYHWDKPRFEAMKAAYQKKYRKPLESRIAGETSGDYKKLLVAIVKGDH